MGELKWYHKAIVYIMLSSITPVVIFQLHLLERTTLQDEMIKHMKNNYNRMQEVADRMEEKFFPRIMSEDIKKASRQLERLELIYDRKYRKEHKAKYGL